MTFCINKDGYAYTQASTRNDLALIAQHYNIPILCAAEHHSRNKNSGAEISRSEPILPHIRLSSGIQTGDISLRRASMKLILSQHAINEGSTQQKPYPCTCKSIFHTLSITISIGKIEPQDICVVLPRITMWLAPGGYASLLLLTNRVRRKSRSS